MALIAIGRRQTRRASQAIKNRERHDYDAVAPYYDLNTTPLTDVFGLRTVELIDPRPGERVLEVACGSGTLLPALARRLAPGGEITGLDQSPGMLALARKRVAREALDGVELLLGDAEELPGVPLAAYDAALSVFGLMYLPDPGAALRRIKSTLRPGGRVAICVWGLPRSVPGLTVPMEAGARVLLPPPLRWLLRTGAGRRLLYRQLLREKVGGGRSPMCLSPSGMLERLMTGAGFRDLRRREEASTFHYRDVEAYWNVLMGTPARLVLEGYPAAKVTRAKAVVAELVEERHRLQDGRLAVPMTAIIVTGRA